MSIPVTLRDADLLARYVFGCHPDCRTWKCREFLARVCEAAFYVKITGQAHPFYGDGSIASLAHRASLPSISPHLNCSTMAAYAVAFAEIAGLLTSSLHD